MRILKISNATIMCLLLPIFLFFSLLCKEETVNPKDTSTSSTELSNSSTLSSTSSSVTSTSSLYSIDGEGYKYIDGQDFDFHWKFEGEYIKIKVSSEVTGWVAIGFDPITVMKNANIIIGYVENDQVYFRDDYADSNYSHVADDSVGGVDNILDKAGSEVDGVTEISFKIPISSEDTFDTVLSEGSTHTVIFAACDFDDFTKKHKKVDIISLQL